MFDNLELIPRKLQHLQFGPMYVCKADLIQLIACKTECPHAAQMLQPIEAFDLIIVSDEG